MHDHDLFFNAANVARPLPAVTGISRLHSLSFHLAVAQPKIYSALLRFGTWYLAQHLSSVEFNMWSIIHVVVVHPRVL